jgi:hypothetical protein
MQAYRFVCAASIAVASLWGAEGTWPLDSVKGLQAVNVKTEAAIYKGKHAVRVMDASGPANAPEGVAIISDSDFEDGTIEVDVAGAPSDGAFQGARGFIGIAFRVADGTHFECFYLRPTNGRADDQLRRNHSTQYTSLPDFGWQKLRTENPGVYESYTDLETGAWTRMKIVVSGVQAKLYVNGAAQPCLIVNDLKRGKSKGKIALWVGVGTDGYFSNLVVKK